MDLIKNLFKRTILIIVLISILITFLVTPASYAELKLEEDEFYYAGTTEGSYVPRFNIFAWLINNIGEIADWLLGIITMGFRMVFVGWTALLEKALTWALESTTGVSADGSLVESSTDLTGLTDSSNNITVEAIVYNKVAGLNIDFFELDFDRGTTGTGNRLVCHDCDKYVAEYEGEEKSGCIKNETADDIRANAAAIKQAIADAKAQNIEYDYGQYCECSCGGCDSCRKYVHQLIAEKPIVLKIRELVATWYSIIRFLAMAAMLVILIAVGIKMALSTIASDKAVYKRMLVDWIGGIIILFAIHYFMIFCIHMNNVVVKTIEESAQSINKVQMQEVLDDKDGITNAELEIKVYEEVRTRAYDARLINGMMGMIMYMTLVYFAFKYTLIYLKRYLTLLVLTLMGPGVGVAYALQKVLSGKSSALSTWMKEYIMNTIIQIVHALLYAIFISQAMVLSLQSIAGMVMALILMNYTVKADELFKKIFNFGGGDSLVGHTSNAMEDSLQGIQTAKGLVTGAKPLASAITNTPYGKAVKGVGKLALAGVAGAGAGLATLGRKALGPSKNDQYDEAIDKELDAVMGESIPKKIDEKTKELETDDQYLRRMRDEAIARFAGRDNNASKFKNQIAMDSSRSRLEEEVKNAKKYLAKSKEGGSLREIADKRKGLIAAQDSLSKHDKKDTPTAPKVALGHAKRIFEINNEFNFRKSSGVGDKKLAWDNIRAVHDGVFGSVHWDKNSWKFTREKNAVFNQFSAENLLGMNAQDRKMFKEHVITPMLHGFIGMGSLFVGMGTIVANPKIGMGLLATGVTLSNKTFKKPTNIKSYKRTYTFSRFGISTMNTIKNSAIAQARRERRGLTIADLEQRRPTFTQRLKEGNLNAISLLAVGVPIALPAYVATHPWKTTKAIAGSVIHPVGTMKKSGRFVANVAKTSAKDAKQTVLHPVKTMGGAIKGVGNVALAGVTVAESAALGVAKAPKAAVDGFIANTSFAGHKEAMDRYNALEQEKRIKQFKKEADSLISIQAAAEIAAIEKQEEERIKKELYEAAGYDYDPKTGIATPKGEQTTETRQKARTVDIDATAIEARVNDTKITEADVTMIDKELEAIIQDVASGREIDCSSQAIQGEIIQKLSDKLIKSGLLKEGQSAEMLFKKGKSGLNATIKKKAKRTNSTIKEASKNLESFLSREEVAAVANIVSQEINEQRAAGTETVNVPVEKVISKLNPSRDGSASVSSSDGSRNVSMNGSGDGSRSVRGDNRPPVTDRQRTEAIASFIQAVTPVATPAKPKEDLAKKKVTAEVNREVKNRKKKLQQVMAMAMEVEIDNQPVSTPPQDTDSVVLQLLKGHGEKRVTDGSRTISLSGAESEAATRMVKKLLEIKEANREAVQELDLKKGTKGYAKAKKKKSELTIEIYKLEQTRKKAEGGNSVTLDDKDGNPKVYTPTEAIAEIDKRKAKKVAAKAKVAKEQDLAGPIYDINDLIKNQMGRR